MTTLDLVTVFGTTKFVTKSMFDCIGTAEFLLLPWLSKLSKVFQPISVDLLKKEPVKKRVENHEQPRKMSRKKKEKRKSEGEIYSSS